MATVCLALVPANAFSASHMSPAERDLTSLTVDEIADLEGLLASGWQSSLDARAGVGWDSNLLLSSIVREQSGFSRASVEGMLWRPAREKQPVELVGFLSATYRRMFSSKSLPDDAEAFFQGEARWRPAPPVRFSLLAQGYYLDSVLDLSTESERVSTPLRNAGFNAGAAGRWDVGSRRWLEVTATINRSNFRLIPEDYQERRLGVRAGWQSADGKLKLHVGAREYDRRYQERNFTTPSGRPIAGTQLRYRAPEFSGNVEKFADWRGKWKFTGTVSESRNDDNGSGYFDYRLGKLLATIEWAHAPWEVQLSVGANRYRWDEQVAGIGLDPPRRRRLDETFVLQVNRQIGEHLFVFLDAERECVSSNDPSAGYNLTVFSTGIGWKL